MTSTTRIQADTLHKFLAHVFQCLGVPQDDAWTAAGVIVLADVRGVETHGINNLDHYVDSLRVGRINPTPNVAVVRESPITAVLDGDGGMGLVVGVKAMEMCIAKAEAHGLGAVAVRRSMHYGMASYYSLMCLPHDMIGLSMTNNSRPTVFPTFGLEPMTSTNPISVAAPTNREAPYVMDFATSAVANSRVDLMRKTGATHIPFGWALDKEGNPTDDPQKALDALTFVPLGGTRELGSHKGYGLSVLVDILTGLLSGGIYGNLRDRVPPADEKLRYSSSHFFMALRVDYFRPIEEFKAAMDDMLRALKDSKKAAGHDRIYTHGEIEFETEGERRANGIPDHAFFVDQLRALATELDIPFDDLPPNPYLR
jgi:L-2-hydroxycarboxylate dehydrogenase (NAD+)